MRVLKRIPSLSAKKIASLVALCLVSIGLLAFFMTAYGSQQLLLRSLQVSNSLPGATADYSLTATLASSETLGSIRIQFCANDPFINTACTPPNGFSIKNATLSGESGITDFTVSNSSTDNVVILTRTAGSVPAGQIRYLFSGATNPSAGGSYYARVQTYASEDVSGPDNDAGGLAFAILQQVSINAEVPPYLLFCSALTISNFDCNTASGSYLNLGNLSTSHSSSGQSQLLAATNAQNGYNIAVFGSTLTSGNNTIASLTQDDVSRPGSSQFGLNLRANTDPAVGAEPAGAGNGVPQAGYDVADRFMLHSGDIIAMNAAPEDYRLYTVSYLVNIASSQPPGIYASTLTYTATGNF